MSDRSWDFIEQEQTFVSQWAMTNCYLQPCVFMISEQNTLNDGLKLLLFCFTFRASRVKIITSPKMSYKFYLKLA